jgi:uncharacterized membrane protein
MTRIEKQIVVGRPVTLVFDYARTWRNIPTYLDYVREVRPLTEQIEGLGARYSVDITFMGLRMHSEWETVEYSENEGWTFTAPLMGVVARKLWRFEPVDGSTRISFTLEYDPKPPVIAPLVDALVLRRQWDQIYQRGMENLKRILESEPPQDTTG